jgi:hypothetical protein
MKKKTKGSKRIEFLIKKNLYDDAQNQMKKTKTKRKSPSPTIGGMIDHFRKTIQKIKGQEISTSDP